MAYMSEVGERVSMQPWGAQGWDRQAEMSSRAIREAERILAETEAPDTITLGIGTLDRGRHGTLHDTITVERRTSNRRRHPRQTIHLQALATALSAVLPALDELAEQATKDAYLSPRVMDEDSFWSLWDSNRATLAALESR